MFKSLLILLSLSLLASCDTIQLEDELSSSLNYISQPYDCSSNHIAGDSRSLEQNGSEGQCSLSLSSGILDVTFSPNEDDFDSTDTCIVEIRTNIFGGQVIDSVEYTFDYSNPQQATCSEVIISSTTTGPSVPTPPPTRGR